MKTVFLSWTIFLIMRFVRFEKEIKTRFSGRPVRAVPRDVPGRLGLQREDAGTGAGRWLRRAEVGSLPPGRRVLRDRGLGVRAAGAKLVLAVPARQQRRGARARRRREERRRRAPGGPAGWRGVQGETPARTWARAGHVPRSPGAFGCRGADRWAKFAPEQARRLRRRAKILNPTHNGSAGTFEHLYGDIGLQYAQNCDKFFGH